MKKYFKKTKFSMPVEQYLEHLLGLHMDVNARLQNVLECTENLNKANDSLVRKRVELNHFHDCYFREGEK